MPKKGQTKPQKATVKNQEDIVKESLSLLSQAVQSSTVEYIVGLIEGEENYPGLLANQQELMAFLTENLEDESVSQAQILDLSERIVINYCALAKVEGVYVQEEESKLDEGEIQEQQKQDEQKLNKYKSLYGDFIEDFNSVDWNEETVQQFEEIKKQQEIQMKYGCVLCERIAPLTFHHLTPKTTHDKPYNKGKTFAELNVGIWICRQCHSGCHRIIDEESMAKEYYTFDLLLKNEKIVSMVKYMSKQKLGHRQDQRCFDDPMTYIRDNKRDKL